MKRSAPGPDMEEFFHSLIDRRFVERAAETEK